MVGFSTNWMEVRLLLRQSDPCWSKSAGQEMQFYAAVSHSAHMGEQTSTIPEGAPQICYKKYPEIA
jgi:hypothetical protein